MVSSGVSTTPVLDKMDEIVHAIAAFVNISERKQAQPMLAYNRTLEAQVAERSEALQQQKEILQTLFEHIPVMLAVYQNESLLLVNREFERVLGWSFNELAIVDWLSECYPNLEERQKVFEHIQAATGAWQDFQTRRKDGRVIDVSWANTRLSDGKLICIGRDITERQAARRERQQAEQQLELQAIITRNMADGVCLVKAADWTIAYANPRFEQIFGYDSGELNGKPVSILNYTSDEANAEAATKAIIDKIEENGEATYEVHNVKRDGTPFWCRATTSKFDHPEYGTVYVAVQEDISDRRQIERMKDEFISIVSHELRTPLTAIQGSLGLLNSEFYLDKPETAKSLLQIAFNNSKRLVCLVNDILDLERLESGKTELVKETCDVTDLMQQAIELVQSLAEQAAIDLCMIPASLHVQANPSAIVQTLTNLLSNAIKFSPRGSTVRLKAEMEHGNHISLHSPLPTPSILFSITDPGRGIPSDKLTAIFDRFQQVNPTDSREKGGTGLGLAICKSIVEKHGGQIWVESTLGQGSTFYFTLPCSYQASFLSEPNG